MIDEMPKRYDPVEVEPRWYAWWMERGLFRAEDESDKPAYCISMPPPNVTGMLHMGHALTATLQDILTRWRRMQGYNALWLPGTDHAGIATQMVVERELQKDGVTRFDLGRERFIERVWEWKHHYHRRISEQHQRLGISCDWERERFTMDEGLSEAVREVFVRLYEEGICYRSERLVNWSPKMHTVLSDLEVEATEEDGSLWHIAYPVVGSDERLVVATTRPETMLGDTAVAVHPDDARYQHLIGGKIALPLTDREIPIIADAILVDMEFGSGAVKVTPAHDFNDFETGKRHGLEMLDILDIDARLNQNAPERYRGLDRYDARERVVADLDAAGLLVAVKPHKLSIGRSQRSGEVVEPRLSFQWFVDAAVLAKPAIAAVEDGTIRIHPDIWKKTYDHWMYNIREWCVSRQLWWGHQIPAWYCDDCDGVSVDRVDPTACKHCGSERLTRDPDVLDTWFSSGLWPFSTLGWPHETAALRTFYPNAVMETGHDILFFWVARMIMLGCHFMGEVPFRDVYLHAMVRDKDGQKMSKTKGNVVDPLDIVGEHGADALRFTLAALTVAGRSIKLSEDRVKGYRNFATKVWNASRFALMNLADYDPAREVADAELSAPDRWILTKSEQAAADVGAALEAFDFGGAAAIVYRFFWHELCDWYIELAKVSLDGAGRAAAQRTLRTVLDRALRLLHPFMPHLTEEIWQRLPRHPGDAVALMVSTFPAGDGPRYDDAAAVFDEVLDVVSALRTIRGENGIAAGRALTATLVVSNPTDASRLEQGREYIQSLGNLASFDVTSGLDVPKGCAVARAGRVEVVVPLAGFVDFGEERRRLEKTLQKLAAEMGRVEGKLTNERFIAKAPPEVVLKEREKLDQLRAEAATCEQGLARLPE